MTLTGTPSPRSSVAAASTGTDGVRRPTAPGRGPSRATAAVAALAVVAAVWAVVASVVFVPHLTDNGDEAVYLLQAEALRAGHLFPPAAEPTEAFLPWLSTPAGDHYVTKYTPVFPGFIAATHRVFGSQRAALALVAGGAVVACYWLAREVIGRRRDAAVAAAFLAGSPLFVIQSATYLSYLFSAGLLMGFAAAFLAGLRLSAVLPPPHGSRRSRAALALAGLLLGLAVFARPFDALLFAGPVLAWRLASGRHAVRRLLGVAGWVGLGAALPMVAMLAYFDAATGSPFRPPFTFVGPDDTLGFGLRRMYAQMPFLDYTPGRALLAFGRLTVLTGFWAFGGLLLVGLAVIGHRRIRRSGRWLVPVAAAVPLGYLFFWGSFSSTEWGGPWRFGPYYWLPVIVPVSILGAAGFTRLRRWDRVVARFVAAGMAAVSLFVVTRAMADHRQYRAGRDRLYAAPREAARTLDRAVVFLPPVDGPWLLQPFSLARNATFDGPVVWAIDGGERRNLDVVRRLPDRAPYRVVSGATPRSPTRLQRLAVVDGRLVAGSP